VPTSVLAIDPGVTTGLAFAKFNQLQFYNAVPSVTAEMIDVEGMYRTLEMRMATVNLVVIEKFTITAATAKKSTAGSNTAIELIGIVKYIARKSKVRVDFQSPSDAMNFITDDKLKRLGLYTKGPDHARDATRHLLLAAVRHQLIDPTLLLHGNT
jgi:hypothetical protein